MHNILHVHVPIYAAHSVITCNLCAYTYQLCVLSKNYAHIYIYIYIYILIMTQIQYIFYVFVTSKHVTYKEYAQVLLTTSNHTGTGYCLHNVLLEYQS